MDGFFALAAANLLSPAVLAFALGFGAAMARSDLSVPEAAAKAMSLYLLFAIGFKGGVGVAEAGAGGQLVAALLAGTVLSAATPFLAFVILRRISTLSRIDAAAVAAHYGSISVVTFVAGTTALTAAGIAYEGFMVAVAAAMEAPAILAALWLVGKREGDGADLWRDVFLNGSIVLLVGSFGIGWVTGPSGLDQISPFIVAPFAGVLCIFLLDMGLVAGRGFRDAGAALTWPVLGFGIAMPLIGASCGLAAATAIGLSTGGAALMAILAGSASYIAVPAAMRVALPEANPSISLTMSLGVTFPFNLTLGVPLYIAAAATIGG
ncbi:MAG: sodium-dependent bicarbonate transport family permease [Pseudomonadota bacterium]